MRRVVLSSLTEVHARQMVAMSNRSSPVLSTTAYARPTRREAGTRLQRFVASTSAPVIRVGRVTAGGPYAQGECRPKQPLVDAATAEYERKSRSRPQRPRTWATQVNSGVATKFGAMATHRHTVLRR